MKKEKKIPTGTKKYKSFTLLCLIKNKFTRNYIIITHSKGVKIEIKKRKGNKTINHEFIWKLFALPCGRASELHDKRMRGITVRYVVRRSVE